MESERGGERGRERIREIMWQKLHGLKASNFNTFQRHFHFGVLIHFISGDFIFLIPISRAQLSRDSHVCMVWIIWQKGKNKFMIWAATRIAAIQTHSRKQYQCLSLFSTGEHNREHLQHTWTIFNIYALTHPCDEV